ncbi:ATP-binding cassette domain-containing protein [Thermogemmatispora sp.]|uniref:ATP-binding cassette domain-containing protein n=1 Tax=Thermogemmatispora sp. TaxID=1968838 RepID=UPI001D8FE5AD|nr:ATP-binding cassette domain-containing protein [Thermogemmatispora sp.]MBX5449238.1 ATP-binding cassette domain-containing protein [Thermogemmatispora sp.]
MRKRQSRRWLWMSLAILLLACLMVLNLVTSRRATAGQGGGGLIALLTSPDFVVASLVAMTPLLLAALGGLFNELAGVLNLALEAIMLCGALAAYMGALAGHSPWVGLLAAIVVGMLIALVHAWFSVTLRVDQIVSAVGLNLFALAATAYVFRLRFGNVSQFPSAPGFGALSFPLLSSLPYIGPAFFQLNALVYIALALVPLTWFVLYRTTWGLALRAVGEKPLAATTVGIDVQRVRYLALLVCGALAGAGGAALVSASGVNAFQENMSAGRGYVAFAAIVFGRWHPLGILLGVLLFGFGDALQIRLQAYGVNVPYQLLETLPYVITLLALMLLMRNARGPAASGQPYSNEGARSLLKGASSREEDVEQATPAMTGAILELRRIVKRFPGVVANDHVTLAIRAGEIHALLGENGAGKTTLMNIVYGLYRPDEGHILVEGRRVQIRTPREAMQLGIGMVHQHFMLIPALSILENIVLGTKPERSPLLDLRQAERRIAQLSRSLGLEVSPYERVQHLTLGQQQKVEIMKALYRGARLLILDEPTAVLTPQESEELFALLRRLRAEGVTIIFISHKLKEVMAISDRVTVMRLGRVVRTLETRQATLPELARLMVGRAVALTVVKEEAARMGEVRLRLEQVQARGGNGREALRGISLELRAGEIHGLAGVDGNGQSELLEVLMGLRRVEAGRILFEGRDITALDTAARLDLALAHIPEDRQRQGLILELSVAENMVLDVFDHPPYARYGWRRFGAVVARAQQLMVTFDVRAPSPLTPMRHLSGGNQQKAVLARALGREPRLLIAMQPTRGLDVGAIAYVHRRIVEARDRGCAVLLISSDLDEILALSDRISVIYEGRILETLPAEAVDLTHLGLLMAGTRPEQAQPPQPQPQWLVSGDWPVT